MEGKKYASVLIGKSPLLNKNGLYVGRTVLMNSEISGINTSDMIGGSRKCCQVTADSCPPCRASKARG